MGAGPVVVAGRRMDRGLPAGVRPSCRPGCRHWDDLESRDRLNTDFSAPSPAPLEFVAIADVPPTPKASRQPAALPRPAQLSLLWRAFPAPKANDDLRHPCRPHREPATTPHSHSLEPAIVPIAALQPKDALRTGRWVRGPVGGAGRRTDRGSRTYIRGAGSRRGSRLRSRNVRSRAGSRRGSRLRSRNVRSRAGPRRGSRLRSRNVRSRAGSRRESRLRSRNVRSRAGSRRAEVDSGRETYAATGLRVTSPQAEDEHVRRGPGSGWVRPSLSALVPGHRHDLESRARSRPIAARRAQMVDATTGLGGCCGGRCWGADEGLGTGGGG